MKSLRQRMMNDFESERGLATRMAKLGGYASAAKLKQSIEKPKGEIQNFDGFVKVVNELYPDNYLNYLSQFTDEIIPGKATARYLLEFLSLNRQFDGVENLISKMKTKHNVNTEWALAYELLINHQKNCSKIDYNEMLIQIRSMKTNNSELNLFLNILRTYCYHQLGRFNMVTTLADEIEYDLRHLKNNYLIQMYRVRHSETMSYLTLRLHNQPEKARVYADKVIYSETFIGESFNAYAHFIKGYSYMFSSYDFASTHLTISRNLYDGLNRVSVVTDLEEKIEMVNVLWNKKVDCKYVKNQLLQNLDLDIDKLIEEHTATIDNPFRLFLEGRSKKDNNILLDSLISYLRVGDFFLANLPKIELLQNGFNEKVLNNLLKLRVA